MYMHLALTRSSDPGPDLRRPVQRHPSHHHVLHKCEERKSRNHTPNSCMRTCIVKEAIRRTVLVTMPGDGECGDEDFPCNVECSAPTPLVVDTQGTWVAPQAIDPRARRVWALWLIASSVENWWKNARRLSLRDHRGRAGVVQDLPARTLWSDRHASDSFPGSENW